MKQINIIAAVGINSGALSCYVNGKYKPKQDAIHLLSKALNVSEAWLMGQDVPMGSPPKTVKIEEVPDIPGAFVPEFKKTVPILGRIAAGTPIFADEHIEYHVSVENENIDFALIVKGDSMANLILPDSIVFVQQDAEIKNGVVVVALVNGDEATVKYFHRYGDHIVLRPENPNYPEQEYPVEDVTILGRVIEMKYSFI